jgi:NAD-reducing hydrogenase small subunit
MSDGAPAKARVATVWLGGCSGCHMSFLDMDEWLFDFAERADVVYSPIADVKDFPEDVDLTLIEGAVANEDNRELALTVRANSKAVVSFGDCAVTGNVTALRNPMGDPSEILARVYVESPDLDGVVPSAENIVPPLLPKVLPVHQLIPVDVYLPGCPPPADRIREALETLLDAEALGDRGEAIRFG